MVGPLGRLEVEASRSRHCRPLHRQKEKAYTPPAEARVLRFHLKHVRVPSRLEETAVPFCNLSRVSVNGFELAVYGETRQQTTH